MSRKNSKLAPAAKLIEEYMLVSTAAPTKSLFP